jgi:hypothetical protein
VIAVTKIDNVQPVQALPQRGEPRRNGYNDAVQRAESTGRAVATQRDAFYFRSQEILRQDAPATAPYLAQQISQLWPTSPAAVHKTVVHAYAQNSLVFGRDEHEESVLA